MVRVNVYGRIDPDEHGYEVLAENKVSWNEPSGRIEVRFKDDVVFETTADPDGETYWSDEVEAFLEQHFLETGAWADLKPYIGQRIESLEIEDKRLTLRFEGGGSAVLRDRVGDCCERRYFSTDDDLSYFEGSRLLGAEVRYVEGTEPVEAGIRETAFLYVNTSKGVLNVNAYNEHNGYYAGLLVSAKGLEPLPRRTRSL